MDAGVILQFFHICYVGGKGRPKVHVTTDQLTCLLSKGMTAVEIAKQLGCSASLVYKKLYAENRSMRQEYSNIDDAALDAQVRQLHENHSNAGIEVWDGDLKW